MNYAEIKYCDIANGAGVRTSLFVSGCTHHCEGCFNKSTWDFNYGRIFTEEVEGDILKSLEPSYIAGLSLLGGEPFEPQNQQSLANLLEKAKERFPDKTVWCYTGYTLEQLKKDEKVRCEATDKMLGLIDVLVDGEFVRELYDISLKFRGSSNQRIINLPETLKENKIVLWEK